MGRRPKYVIARRENLKKFNAARLENKKFGEGQSDFQPETEQAQQISSASSSKANPNTLGKGCTENEGQPKLPKQQAKVTQAALKAENKKRLLKEILSVLELLDWLERSGVITVTEDCPTSIRSKIEQFYSARDKGKELDSPKKVSCRCVPRCSKTFKPKTTTASIGIHESMDDNSQTKDPLGDGVDDVKVEVDDMESQDFLEDADLNDLPGLQVEDTEAYNSRTSQPKTMESTTHQSVALHHFPDLAIILGSTPIELIPDVESFENPRLPAQDSPDPSIVTPLLVKRKRKRPNLPVKTPLPILLKRRRTPVQSYKEQIMTPNDRVQKKYTTCKVCNKIYSSAPAFYYHMKGHLNLRNFLCDTCGIGFNTKHHLKCHMFSHTDERSHLCDQCPQAFKRLKELKTHIARCHIKEKPFACEICKKMFFSRTTLRNHSVIHFDVRDFKCTFCPKTFRSKKHLTQHVRIHTGVKPYKCEPCGKSFVQIGSLKFHNRTHHSEKNK